MHFHTDTTRVDVFPAILWAFFDLQFWGGETGRPLVHIFSIRKLLIYALGWDRLTPQNWRSKNAHKIDGKTSPRVVSVWKCISLGDRISYACCLDLFNRLFDWSIFGVLTPARPGDIVWIFARCSLRRGAEIQKFRKSTIFWSKICSKWSNNA